jgi:2-haloacid dehalogenase
MDVLIRELFDEVIDKFSTNGLTSADRDNLNNTWQSLDGWPYSSAGLSQLGNNFLLAAFSNGSIDMLKNISNNTDLGWGYVISAEMFGTYKPDPKVYLGACSVLDLPPENIMMVAAHKYDLEAAKAQGMYTAFIVRLEEFGSLRSPDAEIHPFIDVYPYDSHQLATELGL